MKNPTLRDPLPRPGPKVPPLKPKLLAATTVRPPRPEALASFLMNRHTQVD